MVLHLVVQSKPMIVFNPRDVPTTVFTRLCLRLLLIGWQSKAYHIENKSYTTIASELME